MKNMFSAFLFSRRVQILKTEKIQPILYSSQPIRLQIFFVFAIRINNLKILKIKNVKFSEYYYMNLMGNFPICIGVPLMNFFFFMERRSNIFFVKEYNIEIKSTMWPILRSSRPIRSQIFC